MILEKGERRVGGMEGQRGRGGVRERNKDFCSAYLCMHGLFLILVCALTRDQETLA